jgi:hypothetical protein
MENNDGDKKKKAKTASSKNNKLSNLDKAQIQELLSGSVQNYVKRIQNDAKDIEDSIELINGYMSEFLQAFIVFGYDMKGTPICIHHATNQMDADALNSLVNRLLFNRGE